MWGFLDEIPMPELITTRKPLFAEVAHPGHYTEREHLVAMVPGSTLRLAPDLVRARHAVDWQSLLDLHADHG